MTSWRNTGRNVHILKWTLKLFHIPLKTYFNNDNDNNFNLFSTFHRPTFYKKKNKEQREKPQSKRDYRLKAIFNLTTFPKEVAYCSQNLNK